MIDKALLTIGTGPNDLACQECVRPTLVTHVFVTGGTNDMIATNSLVNAGSAVTAWLGEYIECCNRLSDLTGLQFGNAGAIKGAVGGGMRITVNGAKCVLTGMTRALEICVVVI